MSKFSNVTAQGVGVLANERVTVLKSIDTHSKNVDNLIAKKQAILAELRMLDIEMMDEFQTLAGLTYQKESLDEAIDTLARCGGRLYVTA